MIVFVFLFCNVFFHFLTTQIIIVKMMCFLIFSTTAQATTQVRAPALLAATVAAQMHDEERIGISFFTHWVAEAKTFWLLMIQFS